MSPTSAAAIAARIDRKSTRLNSSHTEIYTLSLHDALPISVQRPRVAPCLLAPRHVLGDEVTDESDQRRGDRREDRSEEHTSELQSHRDLHSFPTRRSSDLGAATSRRAVLARAAPRARRRSDR